MRNGFTIKEISDLLSLKKPEVRRLIHFGIWILIKNKSVHPDHVSFKSFIKGAFDRLQAREVIVILLQSFLPRHSLTHFLLQKPVRFQMFYLDENGNKRLRKPVDYGQSLLNEVEAKFANMPEEKLTAYNVVLENNLRANEIKATDYLKADDTDGVADVPEHDSHENDNASAAAATSDAAFFDGESFANTAANATLDLRSICGGGGSSSGGCASAGAGASADQDGIEQREDGVAEEQGQEDGGGDGDGDGDGDDFDQQVRDRFNTVLFKSLT